MSVSFFAAMAPIVGFDLQCVCGATYLGHQDAPMSEEVAMATLVTVKAAGKGFLTCEDEDCFLYGIHLKALDGGPDSPEVNMANGNVVAVLEALGLKADGDSFEDVCYGSLPAEDFLGRILMAEAVAPVSAERPTVGFYPESQPEMAEPGMVAVKTSAVFIHCGVGEGYVQDRLADLRRVAEFAVEHGREVCWS